MPHDVFVSYSAKDKAVADAIVAGLEQDGRRCWFAPRDILAGTTWGEAIVEAVRSARIMVLVLSERSNRSKQVLREVELAVSSDAIIIPFRIDSNDPTGAMAYFLATEHWLDAMSPPLEAHIEQLVATVRALCEGGSAAPVAAVPEAPGTAEPDGGRSRRVAISALVGAILIIGVAATFLVSAGRSTSDPSASDDVGTSASIDGTDNSQPSDSQPASTSVTTAGSTAAENLGFPPPGLDLEIGTAADLESAADAWSSAHEMDADAVAQRLGALAAQASSEWAGLIADDDAAAELSRISPPALCQLTDDGEAPDDISLQLGSAAAESRGLTQPDDEFAGWVSSVATELVCPEYATVWQVAAGGLGERILRAETFDDVTPGFVTGTFDAGSIVAEDGAYRFAPDPAGYILESGMSRDYDDVVVDVWTRQTAGPMTPNSIFALSCRETSTPPFGTFYHFQVLATGAAELWRYDSDGVGDFLGSSGVPLRPMPEVNHLTVVCDGPALAMLVNGQLVLRAEDDVHSSGWVTMSASTTVDEVEYAFDNLIIREPAEDAQELLDQLEAGPDSVQPGGS